MSWIKNAFIIIISTVISLALADFIIKNVQPVTFSVAPNWVPDGYSRGYYEPYSLVQGSIGHNRKTPFPRATSSNYYLNKFGHRGEDWDIEDENNILFFGGSSTFSFHDNVENSWPSITIECLNELNKQEYRLVNLSIPGNSIFDVPHQYIQKGLRIQHKAVIVFNLWNDMKFISQLSNNELDLFTTPIAENTDYVAKFFKQYVPFKQFFGTVYLIYRNTINTANEHFESDGKVLSSGMNLWLREVKQQYENIINLADNETKIFLLKQSLLLHEKHSNLDSLSGFEKLGLTKAKMIEARNAYYSILDELAILHENVSVIDTSSVVPRDLEHFEDHVHLQPKGQKVLGISICKSLSELLPYSK